MCATAVGRGGVHGCGAGSRGAGPAGSLAGRQPGIELRRADRERLAHPRSAARAGLAHLRDGQRAAPPPRSRERPSPIRNCRRGSRRPPRSNWRPRGGRRPPPSSRNPNSAGTLGVSRIAPSSLPASCGRTPAVGSRWMPRRCTDRLCAMVDGLRVPVTRSISRSVDPQALAVVRDAPGERVRPSGENRK